MSDCVAEVSFTIRGSAVTSADNRCHSFCIGLKVSEFNVAFSRHGKLWKSITVLRSRGTVMEGMSGRYVVELVEFNIPFDT